MDNNVSDTASKTNELPPPNTLLHSLLHSFTPSLIHSFTPSLTHSFTPSLLHSLTHALTPSLTFPNDGIILEWDGQLLELLSNSRLHASWCCFASLSFDLVFVCWWLFWRQTSVIPQNVFEPETHKREKKSKERKKKEEEEEEAQLASLIVAKNNNVTDHKDRVWSVDRGRV